MTDDFDDGYDNFCCDCERYNLFEPPYRSAFCYISGQSLNVGLQVLYASRQSKDYLRDGIYTASEIMNERWNAASWWSLYRINTPDKYYVCDSN